MHEKKKLHPHQHRLKKKKNLPGADSSHVYGVTTLYIAFTVLIISTQTIRRVLITNYGRVRRKEGSRKARLAMRFPKGPYSCCLALPLFCALQHLASVASEPLHRLASIPSRSLACPGGSQTCSLSTTGPEHAILAFLRLGLTSVDSSSQELCV